MMERRASGREAITATRVEAAEEHARNAARRDELADRRDAAAAARDRVAECREAELLKLVDEAAAAESVLERAKKLRAEAAQDRARAAEDRRIAARDRDRDAREREEALEALHCAHFDELTGAHRRAFGEEALSAEIKRARRSGDSLALAFVDVDGLKGVNDSEGHLAGDFLLCEVVDAIRANIREYEPVIRLGGDEFAFAMSGFDADGMAERCAVIRADLARRPSGGRISIGIAELEPEDDLADLFRRADEALLEARATRAAP
jgi:diguanylate cyclase (GGDEF)-like protein